MFRSKNQSSNEFRVFVPLLVVSFGVHLTLLYSLPGKAESAAKAPKARVVARLVKPPAPPRAPEPVPPTPTPKPPEPKKVEPKKVEARKVEAPKPAAKPAVKKKVRRKRRKKRRPARTLVAKKSGISMPSVNANPAPEKTGSVTDLGDWDPDATDEEVKRTYEPTAKKEPKVTAPIKVVKPKKVPKDRKATCRKCIRPAFPKGATAVLPSRVVLSIKVRANGTVASVTVVSAKDPLLAKAARRALLKSTFKPAIKNGVRVSDRIPFTVEFK